MSITGNPLIISCAVMGAEVTPETYPYIPKTPEELADAAHAAVLAGASIIHLHVRDENHKPTQDVNIFEKVTKEIKKRCDCIIQYSTGGAVGTPVELRTAPLKLKPEMATLSMGTMNFGNDIFENSETTIKAIAKTIMDNNVLAELEIFDYGMIESVPRYVKNGWIPNKYHVDFVLGVPGGMTGELRNLQMLVEKLPAGQAWTTAGIGRYQLPLTSCAIAMGGHVRVGIEDNIYFRKGEMAKSNAQFVERVTRIAKELERPVATIKQAREILGLKD